MQRNSIVKRILSLVLFVVFSQFVNAQFIPKLSLAGGFGVPDLFHAGIKYQASPRSELGIYYGFIYSSSHKSSGWFKDFELNMRSVTLDHSYSFGSISQLSQQHAWFTRQGLNYYHEVGGNDDTFSGLITIGRTIPFSNAAGLKLDAGVAIPLSNRKNIIPAARLQFYVLLSKPQKEE